MQIIDFALVGLAVAAPVAQEAVMGATTCPGINGGKAASNNNQAYSLDCGKWVDTDQLLRITTTEVGFQGCLTACDGTIGCAITQYIASNEAQTTGSCTLYPAGATVKDGATNSWTVATKLDQYVGPDTPPQTPLAPGPDDKFGLIAIHSGSVLQNQGITAKNGRLFVGGKQDAGCTTPSDFATFYLKDGQGWLYGEATPQQLWVDASGMGQGITGYTTASQAPPSSASRTTFTVDGDAHLLFNGISAQACPPADDNVESGWPIWFSEADKPGYNEGCIDINLRAIKADNPVSCFYTSNE